MLPRARAASRRVLRFALVLTAMLTLPPAPTRGVEPTSDSGFQIQLTPAHDRDRARVELSAREALTLLRAWLGPCACPSLTIIEKPWTGPGAHGPGVVLVAPHAWEAPRTMEVESHVAYGVARLWFAHVLDEGGVPVADSLAWYLQSRVVERLFYHPNRALHSDEAERYFGGVMPWVFESLPLSRWSAGLGRSEFLRDAAGRRPSGREARRLPPAMDPRAVRGALAFGTLERHLGWPALQGILHAIASRAPDGPMRRAGFVRAFSAAAGQDLSWFFDAALDPGVRFAYGVTAFSTVPRIASSPATPRFVTRVTVSRTGDGRFTGSSRLPVGDAEAGDAMLLRVTFADGQSVSARWDGRAVERAFEFESPAPAVSAEVDPERVLLLDVTPLSHLRRVSSPTNVSLAKWVARWVGWLEDAMLSYAFVIG